MQKLLLQQRNFLPTTTFHNTQLPIVGTYIEHHRIYNALLTFQALALHSLQAERSLRLLKQPGKFVHT
jgi:hypothetical protein